MHKYNFKPVKTGDTFPGVAFEVLSEETSVPISISGYNIKMQVRKSHSAPIFELQLSTANNGGLIIAQNKLVVLPFLVRLQPGTYVYDIKFVAPDGNVKRWIEGSWQINPIVTR